MNSLLDQSDELPQLDQSKNYLSELVGPDKKFKTAEDLARGKAEADVMIELFKKRQDDLRRDYLELREEANAQAKFQDLVDQLRTPQNIQTPNTIVPEVKQPAVNPDEINSLVSNAIVQHENQKKRTDNYNLVQAKLKEELGDKSRDFLLSKMNTLGLSAEEINETARKSPTAFFNMVGLNKVQSEDLFQNLPRSSQRSDPFAPQGAPKRTWSYYQAMKKSDPAAYTSPKIANQMLDDMVALGDAFKDGDFNN